jgi:sirohydrochlorin cobaltochelatase
MPDAIERALQAALAGGSCDIGQIAIRASDDRYLLTHRDDETRYDLRSFSSASAAVALARNDDADCYRPLKTAPNLRHGWQLKLETLTELRLCLEHFYPGRLGVLLAHAHNVLVTTPLRSTLDRQTGMYRVAAKVSDAQISEIVGRLCRSDGGCLRTILWRRDAAGSVPSNLLPAQKYDPAFDQTTGSSAAASPREVRPLLCQEACTLVVGECRKVVKMEAAPPS